ncbi:hypothetical protein OKJ48_01875 [Streptomyces kunmingensis]|uniref:MarR family transcriptional regulator n=1 Tax=Streptomyces kunmingensis TaxID=68225 RepID=A0ABU6C4H9_9ACTN|nr:hypothetical protein [Streptomyces kunmingensis]MEB3959011.1 hypothetical protein [Streptomyces kunmingensis]
MANPGYGKRSAPDELRRTNDDFAHLPAREAHIAGFIDRLPDGSDISVKLLSRCLPYGQAAMSTALNNIQRAGHLRRGREHVHGSGSARWVTRTWFSRTARGDAWWAAYAMGDVPEATPEVLEPTQRPTRTRALLLLAALGRTAPSLALSVTECARLAPEAERWFTRGATEDDLLRALTAGLPTPVHSPAALLHRRLVDKLPPPAPVATRPILRLIECGKCGAPGHPEALPDGFCDLCAGTRATRRPPAPLEPETVRTRAAEVRKGLWSWRERARV